MWKVQWRDHGELQEREGFASINEAKAFRDRLTPLQATGAVVVFLEVELPNPRNARDPQY